jgi:hypothetical protein
MFRKHWCVGSSARFTAGVDISRTCAIPPREVIRGAQGDVTSLGRGGEYSGLAWIHSEQHRDSSRYL